MFLGLHVLNKIVSDLGVSFLVDTIYLLVYKLRERMLNPDLESLFIETFYEGLSRLAKGVLDR
jgi:hypothetical protein